MTRSESSQWNEKNDLYDQPIVQCESTLIILLGEYEAKWCAQYVKKQVRRTEKYKHINHKMQFNPQLPP